MLLYEGIKSIFIEDVDLNKITDKILERFKEVFYSLKLFGLWEKYL